jgi:hypothetical protein
MPELNMLFTAGLAAGLLRIAGDIIYNYSTWRGGTKPSRVSWLIWVILTYEILVSYILLGATYTLWVPIIATMMTSSVFVLTIYQYEERWGWLLHLFNRKNWGGLEPLEHWCLVIGIIGIAGGILIEVYMQVEGQSTRTITWGPFFALMCSLSADLSGAAAMLPKTWRDPKSEPKLAWTLFFLSGLANLFAAEWEMTWSSAYIWTYVASMFLSDGIVYITLILGTLFCTMRPGVAGK